MLDPGTLLSARYRVQSVLGQGGMGAVYLATMEALGGKKVAVKEMELKGLNSRQLSQAVEQFKKEASFLANLDHPNLVQVTDFFIENNNHYLVMAYVSGETLQQKLKRHGRPFSWNEVSVWAEALVEVLHYLHSQTPPILFRDLKPSNIMVEESGRLRLIDFGIARTAQAGDKTSTFLQGTGTSGFSPIEQYGAGQSTDERSDIYSLGATIYYLLTGKIPPDAVARISQGERLIPATQLQTSLPSGIDQLIDKSLALKQSDRHPNMSSFRQHMLRLQASLSDLDIPTEDLGGLPEVGSTTNQVPESKPSAPAAIMVEMYPTNSSMSSGKQSLAPWVLLGSLTLAGLTILAMVFRTSPSEASTSQSTHAPLQLSTSSSVPSPQPPEPPLDRIEPDRSSDLTEEPGEVTPNRRLLQKHQQRNTQAQAPSAAKARKKNAAPIVRKIYRTAASTYPTAKRKAPVSQELPVAQERSVENPVSQADSLPPVLNDAPPSLPEQDPAASAPIQDPDRRRMRPPPRERRPGGPDGETNRRPGIPGL